MYLDEYKRWLSANLIDFDLHAELAGIEMMKKQSRKICRYL